MLDSVGRHGLRQRRPQTKTTTLAGCCYAYAIAHGMLGKQLRQLERTHHAAQGNRTWRQLRDIFAFKIHFASLRPDQARADIDESRLTGAVLANDSEPLAFMQRKIDMVGNHHGAKRQLQVSGLQ